MSVVLWPRQEVLHLVVPQLGTVGRVLNQTSILEVIWRLTRLQNNDGKISFHRWQTLAKEILKWNDYCVHLFWEILILAIYYLNPELVENSRREDISIDVECVSIFLILHIVDNNSNHRHNTMTAAAAASFDSIWPLNQEGEVYPSSPVASPVSSPVRESNRAHRIQSPGNSPMSPRSPRSSPQPSSPKRANSTARTPRGSTHYLHSVQQKIPLILKALCALPDPNADENGGFGESSIELSPNCQINRRVVDFLGLIMCGGHSRDNAVSKISVLHPYWASEADVMQHDSYSTERTISAKDFIRWINLHLSMNDLLYPVSITPFGIQKDGSNGLDLDSLAKDSKSHQPHKQLTPLTSLTRYNPTVINGSSSTIIHAITMVPSRQTSFRRGSRTQDSLTLTPRQHSSSGIILTDCEDQEMFVDSVQSPGSSPNPTKAFVSLSRDEEHGDDFMGPVSLSHKPETSLPQLFISYCSKANLYMISPYYSASVTGCIDTTIVISAVYGAVIINGCERVKITCACRKLIIMNCLDCEFNVATLSTTIVLGDSRNLTMGPHNVTFKSFRQHLRLAELSALAVESKISGRQQMIIDDEDDNLMCSGAVVNNLWSSICDVNGCLEAITNNQTLFVSQPGGMSGPLPSISSSAIAGIQLPDKFKLISIPWKSEHQAFEHSPIHIPQEYLDTIRSSSLAVEEIKLKVLAHLSNSDNDTLEEDPTEEGISKLMGSSAISKRFMEWLVATDNIQEVLDLIRIDAEKGAGIH